jgi:replication initiation and membrane attachment protein
MDRVRASDQFFAYAKSNISANDYQVLSVLYQPIIGVFAFSLYSTLWSLLNRQNLLSDKYLHGDLESFLNCKIGKLEEARRNLEAIGLLNVFYHNDCFAYELRLPMSASSFINDGVLGAYLQNCVTETRYDRLLKIFKIAPIDKEGFLNVTKSFSEVFPAISETKKTVDGDFVAMDRSKTIRVDKSQFDFRLFLDSFPEGDRVRLLLTDMVKEKLLNLSYVYGIDELAMHTIFAQAWDQENDVLNLAQISSKVRYWYKENHQIPDLGKEPEKIPDLQNGNPTDPATYFNTVTPKTLLSDMSGGLVSDSDLRVVERLIDEIKLDKGVVNVLLAYTIKINEGNIPPFPYYQKIAMSWKRNQIETVELAMDYVRHLASEHLRNSDPAGFKKGQSSQKGTKPDVKIDWLDDFIKTLK